MALRKKHTRRPPKRLLNRAFLVEERLFQVSALHNAALVPLLYSPNPTHELHAERGFS